MMTIGTALFAAGLALIYGGFVTEPLGESGLQVRDVTFSPGVALMGAGLFLAVSGLRRLLR